MQRMRWWYGGMEELSVCATTFQIWIQLQDVAKQQVLATKSWPRICANGQGTLQNLCNNPEFGSGVINSDHKPDCVHRFWEICEGDRRVFTVSARATAHRWLDELVDGHAWKSIERGNRTICLLQEYSLHYRTSHALWKFPVKALYATFAVTSISIQRGEVFTTTCCYAVQIKPRTQRNSSSTQQSTSTKRIISILLGELANSRYSRGTTYAPCTAPPHLTLRRAALLSPSSRTTRSICRHHMSLTSANFQPRLPSRSSTSPLHQGRIIVFPFVTKVTGVGGWLTWYNRVWRLLLLFSSCL